MNEPLRAQVSRERSPSALEHHRPGHPGGNRRDQYLIESGPVRFGDVLAQVPSELPGAVRIRVFSNRPWSLRMKADSHLRVVGGPRKPVPMSRLSWRSPLSGQYQPFNQKQGVLVARGEATDTAGELVAVDMRILLEAADPLGLYECTFGLALMNR